MSNRGKVISIIIIVSMLLGLLVAFLYSASLDNENPFHPNRTGRARILYDNIMSMDENINYPRTAEEVMDMQADILLLLYGDHIIDDSLFTEVIMQQRLLFSDELLEMNTFDDQHYNFMNYVSMLREYDVRLVFMNVMPIVYDPFNSNLGVARVEQNFSGLGTVNGVYYVERSSNESDWKITGWDLTHEEFSSSD